MSAMTPSNKPSVGWLLLRSFGVVSLVGLVLASCASADDCPDVSGAYQAEGCGSPDTCTITQARCNLSATCEAGGSCSGKMLTDSTFEMNCAVNTGTGDCSGSYANGVFSGSCTFNGSVCNGTWTHK